MNSMLNFLIVVVMIFIILIAIVFFVKDALHTATNIDEDDFTGIDGDDIVDK